MPVVFEEIRFELKENSFYMDNQCYMYCKSCFENNKKSRLEYVNMTPLETPKFFNHPFKAKCVYWCNQCNEKTFREEMRRAKTY